MTRWRLLPLLIPALAACVTAVPPPPTPSPTAELRRDLDYAVLRADIGDSHASLAARYFGDPGQAWRIAALNPEIQPGQLVAVPLKPANPLGIDSSGYQTIPILCYHRFGNTRSKLVVSGADFEAQMAYLAHNGYRVVRLQELVGFLQGRSPLPRKSVVLSIDDGYRSSYQIAFPILKKYGFPATVFLYTDFVGAGDALNWAQMQEMSASGLISIQPHSKTHGLLAPRPPQETEAQYRERLRREIEVPVSLLRAQLPEPITSFALPYGATSETVSALIAAQGIPLALTVTPGGNAFFAYPYMLRRDMVFGDEGLNAFAAMLRTDHALDAP